MVGKFLGSSKNVDQRTKAITIIDAPSPVVASGKFSYTYTMSNCTVTYTV